MSMTSKSVYNALPKLPGMSFPELSQRPSYALSQTFVPIPGAVNCTIPRDIVGMKMTTNHGNQQQKSGSSMFPEGAILRKFPLWRTLDDKVLRFFGYFGERVAESMTDRGNDMIHKVVVLFFLGDRSLQVSERPSGHNSGLKSGTIMSKFYDHGQEPLMWTLGDTVTLRGRKITLVDCDAFTREFFEKMNIPFNKNNNNNNGDDAEGGEGAIPYPDEYHEQQMALVAAGSRRAKNNLDDEDYKQGRRAGETLAVIAKQMPAPQFMSAEEKRNARNFLLHDKEVLNFYAVWDRRRFRVSFFLADGTMCVSFLKAQNDGRDPVPNFLKRGKIFKGQYKLKSIDTVAAPRQVAQESYTEEDFRTGETINIMERDFYLYDCDEFTREYYRTQKGIEQESFPKPNSESDDCNPFSRRPQLDKTEELKRKIELQKKNATIKSAADADVVLRFAAVIESSIPQDAGRQFVFCFFCVDNTVAVYELPVRNSGHVGGKIFSRAKVDSISRSQVKEGALIKLGAHTYRLIDSDDRTKAYDLPSTAPPADETIENRATDILDRLRQQVSQRWSRVSDAYLHFNTSKKGITMGDLRNMLRECEIRVGNSAADIAVVARVMERVDRDEDGLISLQEFVSNILRQSLVGGTTADTVQSYMNNNNNTSTNTNTNNNSRSIIGGTEAPPPMQPGAALRLQKLDAERQRQRHANQILESFITKLDARRAFIVDAFRFITDRSADGKIGVDCFRKVVNEKMAMHLSPQDLDALVYRFFAVDGIEDYQNRRISLRDFRRVLSGGWSGAVPES